jgi:hypothetical protein
LFIISAIVSLLGLMFFKSCYFPGKLISGFQLNGLKLSFWRKFWFGCKDTGQHNTVCTSSCMSLVSSSEDLYLLFNKDFNFAQFADPIFFLQTSYMFYAFYTVHCNIIIQYKPTNCTFIKLIFQFKMSSTCFETEDSSSGRRLYLQVWCSVLYIQVRCSVLYIQVWCSVLYIHVWCSVLYIQVWCSVFFIQVWCSVLYIQVWCSVLYIPKLQ